ncbi:MAG: ATP-binding protein [Desulfuromonadaceae bacterium]|nr:ATP-binding protein [Desulfuromonadaceae bacterium]
MEKQKYISLLPAAELRRRAEEQLNVQMPEGGSLQTEDKTERILHELQVHRIELEMQNAELRQTRDELETALDRYTGLYDFAPVGYFTLDGDGEIRAVNIAGACLIGAVRSRLIGRRFSLFVADKDRDAFTGFLAAVLTSRIKDSCEVELLNRAKQPLIVQIEAMATASGREFHVAVIDITARREAEDALNLKRQELEELNGSLEARIAQTVEELRQRDQILIQQGRRAAMGDMINNIAHQWRQPLNTLGLYLQELPLVYDNDRLNKEHLDGIVGKSMHLLRHMSRTIDDFKDYFRSDKEKVSFSVGQVIGKTLSLIEESFKDKQIHIAFRKESDMLIEGYPNEYSQVLLNILANARDALTACNSGDPRINIRAFAEDGKTIVTVTDNAGGIAEEIIDKIFDPNFTTKEPDKGTGIGLFMSKTIIEENMGGKLTFQNTGSGAEFRIEV